LAVDVVVFSILYGRATALYSLQVAGQYKQEFASARESNFHARINFRSHFMLPPVQRRAFSEALKLLYTSSCCNLNNPTGYSKVLKYILAINFQYYMILCECSFALLQQCYFSLGE